MNKHELTTILEDAGLSPYQAEAYVTVLELGSASATNIAEASDVPDPRIYDVLRDLEKMGYIETYEQESLQARAYSPDAVLADLRDRADRFQEAAEEIEHRWEQPSMDTYTVSFVKRVDTVLKKAETIIRNAENQVMVTLSVDQFDQLEDALATAKDNGVYVMLALYADEKEALPSQSRLAETATEVRGRGLPMPFLALVDRAKTCFAPHNLSMNQYGVIVDDRTHAYVFHWFFMAGLWEVCEVIYSEHDGTLPRTYTNIRECIRDVRPLLADGATIKATVYGTDIGSDADIEASGTITDVVYTDTADEHATKPFTYFGGQATIELETDETTYQFGGWGAILEEYEAIRVIIEDITYPE
jgi:sugar-specific transcriptional regulator TrmB